jgi:tRNA1(Val) A37 N6-methylase TrmN6
MLRANLAVRGWSGRATVHVKDYRELTLPRCNGTTAFIGNPPYVRHHDIAEAWKAWYSERFASMGFAQAPGGPALALLPANAPVGKAR